MIRKTIKKRTFMWIMWFMRDKTERRRRLRLHRINGGFSGNHRRSIGGIISLIEEGSGAVRSSSRNPHSFLQRQHLDLPQQNPIIKPRTNKNENEKKKSFEIYQIKRLRMNRDIKECTCSNATVLIKGFLSLFFFLQAARIRCSMKTVCRRVYIMKRREMGAVDLYV